MLNELRRVAEGREDVARVDAEILLTEEIERYAGIEEDIPLRVKDALELLRRR